MLLTLLAALASERPHVVLISLDTTRADALSCDGDPPVPFHDDTPDVPRTPNLDALAASGVRFARFWASTPTTLSSHTTMFTGLDPHEHAVVRNGFTLPDGVRTLAGRLREQGWQTRAVLGAAALEAGTGIEAGFEAWDDDVDAARGRMVQRRADRVVDLALDAAEGRDPGRPLFLFVHLFDAHAPYEPPSPFAERFATDPPHPVYAAPGAPNLPLVRDLEHGKADPAALAAVNGRYLGEVAYVDAEVGRLLAGLGAAGIFDGDALVVVVGDHGEVLSEHPLFAWSHGNDVTRGAMRVPLIVKGYGRVPVAERAVVDRQASMESLPSTIERLVGLEPTFGPDLWELVRPGPVVDAEGWPSGPVRPVFQEATRPRVNESTTAWNNLPLDRAVLAGGYRLDAAPARGVPANGPPFALLPVLASMLAAWDARAPGFRPTETPEATERALEALGYVE